MVLSVEFKEYTNFDSELRNVKKIITEGFKFSVKVIC
jgi:hypothetical protein